MRTSVTATHRRERHWGRVKSSNSAPSRKDGARWSVKKRDNAMVLSAGDKNKMQQQKQQREDEQSKYKPDLLLAISENGKREKRKGKREAEKEYLLPLLLLCGCVARLVMALQKSKQPSQAGRQASS